MAIALFDSNILIDALNGVQQAIVEIAYYQHVAISSVTWMELMAKPLAWHASGLLDASKLQAIKEFAAAFSIVHTDDDIMATATQVRAQSLLLPPKVALPDAIIQATALVTGRLLVTRNKKDFRGAHIRLPYELWKGTVINVAAPPAP